MSDPLQASRRELEVEAIGGCRSAYLGGDVIVSRVLNRFLMYLPTEDMSLTPHLATSGYWESWISLVVARTVKPGMVCVNVGAHVGYYASMMAQYAGTDGRVIAVEPQKRMADLLRKTAEANGFKTLTVVNAAAGAAPGEAALYAHPSLTANTSLRAGKGLAETADRVAVTTVDDLTGGGRADFIFIDAEGSEPEVWAGMQKTLRASPNVVVMMEWCPWMLPSPSGLWREIAGGGFNISRVDLGGDIRPYSLGEAVGTHFETLWIRRA